MTSPMGHRSTPIPDTDAPPPPSWAAQGPYATITAPPPPPQYTPPTPGVFLGGMGYMTQPTPPPTQPWQPKKETFRDKIGTFMFAMLFLIGPIIGVGVGVWAFIQAHQATENAKDLSDGRLSGHDRTTLGIDDNTVVSLFDGNAPGAVAQAFEDGLAGTPTRFVEIALYPDYAFATAQDPAAPTHIDRYGWRQGKVDAGSPEQDDPQLQQKLFAIDAVDWDAVATLASQAPGLANVEQGAVTHILVNRSVFEDGFPLTINIYVSGPRGSAYIEAAADGTVIAVH